MNDAQMRRTAAALEPLGIEVVRFDFEYRSRGSRRPDPMPKLRERYAAVVEELRPQAAGRALIIGGRSMGGRVATMLAADGYTCDALLLFAYPLHPAGQPEKLRDAHLPQIRVPVLCFNGTRDSLCRRDLMERALKTVTAPWTMHWIEGADHSLKGEKAMAEIAAADVAIRKRTAKLRALRLAKEAADRAKPALPKATPKKKKST
jgi:predicted alpha/beta-hydrolase family hydrolase